MFQEKLERGLRIAEELALKCKCPKGGGSWRAEERKADFGLFEDSALEDLDFDLVFDPAWDGYAEETSLA